MSSAISKASSQDNFVAYIAAVVVLSLVAIFVFTWSQTRTVEPARPQISYTKFGPYQIETQNFSIATTLAVQTSSSDSRWPTSNKDVLNVIFRKVLAGTDMKTLRSPNGLQSLQEALTEASNNAMHTNFVQAVWLTDFVFQARDS
ncbi:MAG: flagellar basal body-associated FliL family protein [Burkholderiaceae bacterium]|nr:flagellar basal body-associated FliL family protein [Burkholderiaceae bacterium]